VNDEDEQTRTNIHALSGIQTHGLSFQAIKAYDTDCTATGTGLVRWVVHVVHMEEMRNEYKMLVAKPEEKRLLGRSRHKWGDNIKMVLRKTMREGVDWGHLVQDRDQ
jgi:hypothetical protein